MALSGGDEGNLYGNTENGGAVSGCGGTECGVVFKIALQEWLRRSRPDPRIDHQTPRRFEVGEVAE